MSPCAGSDLTREYISMGISGPVIHAVTALAGAIAFARSTSQPWAHLPGGKPCIMAQQLGGFPWSSCCSLVWHSQAKHGVLWIPQPSVQIQRQTRAPAHASAPTASHLEPSHEHTQGLQITF